MQFAILSYPWPEWMALGDIDAGTQVVAVAEKVLSMHAGDGIDPGPACALVTGLAEPEEIIDAWLDAENAYCTNRLGIACSELQNNGEFGIGSHGECRVCAVKSDARFADMIGISCRANSLRAIGFPNLFLRVPDERNRIGIGRLSQGGFCLDQLPEHSVMLDNYRLAALVGGEHYTDLIIASRMLSAELICELLRESAVSSGLKSSFIGVIKDDGYEEYR